MSQILKKVRYYANYRVLAKKKRFEIVSNLTFQYETKRLL